MSASSVSSRSRKRLFSWLRVLLVVGCVGFGAADVASAGPVNVGGPWYEFGFGGAGSQAFACPGCTASSGGNSIFAPAPPWTFTLTSAGRLTVTDAFIPGDSFDVFDFGVKIGSTPSVIPQGNCGSDPLPCSTNPNVSHAIFSLVSGPHSITIFVRDSPIGFGAGFFRTNLQAIPEPSTLMLFATGAGGLMSVMRRKLFRRNHHEQ